MDETLKDKPQDGPWSTVFGAGHAWFFSQWWYTGSHGSTKRGTSRYEMVQNEDELHESPPESTAVSTPLVGHSIGSEEDSDRDSVTAGVSLGLTGGFAAQGN